MNKKKDITEAHVFLGLIHICVQREEKTGFVFLSVRNIVSFILGKDLIPADPQSWKWMKVTLRTAWEYCLLHTLSQRPGKSRWVWHFLNREFGERGKDEALVLETGDGKNQTQQQKRSCKNYSTLKLCLLYLCLLLQCCVDCISLVTSLSLRRILSWV